MITNTVIEQRQKVDVLKHKVGTDSIVEAELRDGPITSEFIAGFDWSTHYEHTRHGIYKQGFQM